MSKDYNATLNLPKTDFPMRAGLPKREPDMLKRWDELDVYHELLKKNEGHTRYSLHDGPPFSNGAIHMGHALNKALKDFIIRSYAMRGYWTPYIPGWDNHGMPIESAIIKEQKLNHKAMSTAEFRSACEAYAEKYIGVQREGFKRLGVIGDWDHPYKTMNKVLRRMKSASSERCTVTAISIRASSPSTGAPRTKLPSRKLKSNTTMTPVRQSMSNFR